MTGLGLVAYGTNVFRDLDLQSVDARFSIRGKQGAPKDIVVVKVDDKTFSDLQKRWEDFRPDHAKLITRLKKDGAKVIVYDVQFTRAVAARHEEDDNKLIEAVGDAGNVVLATTEVDKNGQTNVFGGDETLRAIHAQVGNGNFPPDPGGYDRRMRYEIAKLKTLAVVAAERATGKPVKPFGTTWIDYRGPVETFKTISFSDALRRQGPARLLQGQDRRRRPVGVHVPGPAPGLVRQRPDAGPGDPGERDLDGHAAAIR